MTAIYTLTDFERIGSGTYELDSVALDNINYLCQVIGYTPDTKNTYINQYNTGVTVTHSKKPKEREVRYKAKPKDEEWKRPAFKATVFAALDNTQSLIGDIRILFNKIKESNCEETAQQIIAKIEEIRDSVDYGDDAEMGDKMRQLYDAIYKVAISNKMFSKQYAYVITTINVKYELHELFDQKVEDYFKSMEDIVDVDSNIDYDAYCNFTASNNTRKNITNLLCEMEKLGEGSREYDLCSKLFKRVEENLDTLSKQKEIEEVTENLVIVFSHFTNLIHEYKSRIKTLASFKAGEKPGLTSRTRFKYVDLAETGTKLA
jgi:hypothetical protein